MLTERSTLKDFRTTITRFATGASLGCALAAVATPASALPSYDLDLSLGPSGLTVVDNLSVYSGSGNLGNFTTSSMNGGALSDQQEFGVGPVYGGFTEFFPNGGQTGDRSNNAVAWALPGGGYDILWFIPSGNRGNIQFELDTHIASLSSWQNSQGWTNFNQFCFTIYVDYSTGACPVVAYGSTFTTQISAYGPPIGTLTVSLVDASAAPEPAEWALLMLGMGGMGAALRTRRRLAAR